VFKLAPEQLVDAVVSMFEQLGILTTFGVSESTLRAFVIALRDSYQSALVLAWRGVLVMTSALTDNPYHNFTHAVDVTQAMFVVLTTMKQRKRLHAIDVFAIMVASLCHDSDHPGLTNAFLIATHSPLIEQCSDSSVLEHHHCATAFEVIISSHKPNLLASLSRADRAQFKESVKSTILATDMAKHGVRVVLLRARACVCASRDIGACVCARSRLQSRSPLSLRRGPLTVRWFECAHDVVFMFTVRVSEPLFDADDPVHRELLMLTWLKVSLLAACVCDRVHLVDISSAIFPTCFARRRWRLSGCDASLMCEHARAVRACVTSCWCVGVQSTRRSDAAAQHASARDYEQASQDAGAGDDCARALDDGVCADVCACAANVHIGSGGAVLRQVHCAAAVEIARAHAATTCECAQRERVVIPPDTRCR
jgi:hypothetical protein